MLIGWIGGELVAIAILKTPKRERIKHNAELVISVKKAYWKSGIGSSVLNELLIFSRTNPIIKNVHLSVKANNKRAISLYKKFGFIQSGRQKNYLNVNGNFYDLVLMELNSQ